MCIESRHWFKMLVGLAGWALAVALAIPIREFKPSVAFLDLHMPGMSGTELAAALKAEPWAGALGLIALTGMGSQSDLEATQRAGFDAHLTKPARPDELVRFASEPGSNVISIFADRQRTS